MDENGDRPDCSGCPEVTDISRKKNLRKKNLRRGTSQKKLRRK